MPLQDAQQVNPRNQIRVPKDIILYQLSQAQDRSILDTFLNTLTTDHGAALDTDLTPQRNPAVFFRRPVLNTSL